MKLLLATKNKHKVEEMRALLSDLAQVEVVSAADFPGVEEPEETGETFEDNARLKARYYAEATGLTALADDSGLVVDGLGGRPGVMSSRYGADDAARIARLLEELRDTPDAQRTARFECAMVLVRPGAAGDAAATRGTLEGSIAREARGTNGFGYDPVFHLPARGLRLAELSSEEKNAVSHRGNALREMVKALRDMVG